MFSCFEIVVWGGKGMNKKYRLADGLTKKQRLRKSKGRGRLNERQYAQVDMEMGYIIEDLDKHTVGYDYKRIKRNSLTGKPVGEWEYVECKAGYHSELSPRQKEMKEKYGKRYIIRRNPYQ